ncbi:MAG TPA: 4'-phosphopantetheinyl transferase superfamily protein, partial [Thermoanaerobaculia bacterium]|nr:4'-phosphopantetheinyl transferase superfamily protein [Thermoanaerobaculia bacterium]
MRILELPESWRARAVVLEGPASLALFSDEELAIANAFPLAKRRGEWLLSRAAAKMLPRAAFVCFSHSGNYAGAAVDDVPIGIDVQVVRDVSERAAHLFLTDEEDEAMQRCTIAHRMLHFWCAKEAAWKPRSREFTTLRQLPLALREERASGLAFDTVETIAIGDVNVALSRSAVG